METFGDVVLYFYLVCVIISTPTVVLLFDKIELQTRNAARQFRLEVTEKELAVLTVMNGVALIIVPVYNLMAVVLMFETVTEFSLSDKNKESDF